MKYKHHPKQEYPDVQQGMGILYIHERLGRPPTGSSSAVCSAFDWQKSHKAAEQERQEEEDIEKAIDQVENQKQQAGFYADKIMTLSEEEKMLKASQGLPVIPMIQKESEFRNLEYVAQARAQVEEARRNAEENERIFREHFYQPKKPTLFERFNSLCTPAQYVQLKKEILHAHYQWVTMGTLCKHTLEGYKPEATVPWPQELEGFTEEIIESL